MARSQPYTVACNGGLVKSVNSIDLLKTPGVAKTLQNFEVATEGGYRRINGYSKLGGSSATQPTGGVTDILGVFPYADGVVVCAGTDIFFSNDGITWLQINKLSHSSGDDYTTFTGKAVTARTAQGQCSFALFEGATFDYGELNIADGANVVFSFRMEGSGNLNTRTFHTSLVDVAGNSKAVKYVTVHDHHLIAAGVEDNLNTLYYSSKNTFSSFPSTNAIAISDQIVGIKGFREDLFIFCENSIHKLVNINSGLNDSPPIAIVPVAENVGCLSGYSIQEIGGDLVFLAPDGIRTVAGTARIGDVELGTVSKPIQPLMINLARNIDDFIISSLVIREKSQYRLFYTNIGVPNTGQKGIIGTLRPTGFEWSETLGLEVTSINSNFDNEGIETYYHGDTNGYVYVHDSGDDFDGANIDAKYQTPDYDYGDLGTLKTLHYVRVSASSEGITEPDVQVRFDYGNTDIPQPPDLFDLGVINPPSKFGDALFNTNVFGGGDNPLIRIPLQGSGTSNNFTIISDDTKPPYTINGFYVDYIPSGRR